MSDSQGSAAPDPLLNVERSLVDTENPWPGLAAFRETDAAFFRGREDEAHELRRLVERDALTVLFARSGVGKTSFLRAGVFPTLRAEGFCPVWIRLDLADDGQPLRAQVFEALRRACHEADIEAPPDSNAASLWEYFHRVDHAFWDRLNRLVVPVLAFDQFEEVFSAGRRDEVSRSRAAEFLVELGDLIENRPPAYLKDTLDRQPQLVREFDFRTQPCKVILSFREDYLADIDGLRRQIPSLHSSSRLRLQPMSAAQALKVIRETGGHLVGEDVAAKIVAMAAGVDTVGREDIEVEPALLSVIGRELNEKRLQRGQQQITADLVAATGSDLLVDFYERCVGDMDRRVRYFVEDSLVTESGHRNSVAVNDAIARHEISPEAIEQLVDRRLLRLEERHGELRVELTHDVLTEVVRTSRDRRRLLSAAETRADMENRERAAGAPQDKLFTKSSFTLWRRWWVPIVVAAVIVVFLAGAMWLHLL